MPKKPGIVQRKVKATMEEFSKGELHSGSKRGPAVTSQKQALAIGYSKGRKEAAKRRRK
jgi:hypothetical protein